MNTKNRERIYKIYIESTKEKFLQDYQKEKFGKIIDILSDISSFKDLRIEYLDLRGSIYFDFKINDEISMEIGFYDNGETVYSIRVNGDLYKVDDDLKPEEIVEKINNVLKDLEN